MKQNNYGAQIYQQWADAFRSIDEWHISLDKCCKILAIIYDNGGNEAFTLSTRFVTDWKTAQQRLWLFGGEIPEDRLQDVAEGRNLLQRYVRELEQTYDRKHPQALKDRYPQWAKQIYEEYSLPMFG